MNHSFGLYPEAWLRVHAAEAKRVHAVPGRRSQAPNSACEQDPDRPPVVCGANPDTPS